MLRARSSQFVGLYCISASPLAFGFLHMHMPPYIPSYIYLYTYIYIHILWCDLDFGKPIDRWMAALQHHHVTTNHQIPTTNWQPTNYQPSSECGPVLFHPRAWLYRWPRLYYIHTFLYTHIFSIASGKQKQERKGGKPKSPHIIN